jgi:hypothetical protein
MNLNYLLLRTIFYGIIISTSKWGNWGSFKRSQLPVSYSSQAAE